MNHMKKRLWTSIAAMILLLCALTLGYEWYSSLSKTRDDDLKTDMKMEGIRLTLSDLAEAQAQANSDFERQLRNNLSLLSIPLQSVVRQEGDQAIQNYVYGCVLRKDGDGFILPEDTSAIPLLEPQEYAEMPYEPEPCKPFEDWEGFFWSRLENAPAEDEAEEAAVAAAMAEEAEGEEDAPAESAEESDETAETEDGAEGAQDAPAEQPAQQPTEETAAEEEPENDYVLCAYRQLADQYYYLYYTPAAAVADFFASRVDAEGVMESAETVYEGYFLAGFEEDGDLRLFYGSSLFDGYTLASELGVSVPKGKSGFQKTSVGGEDYMYAVSAPTSISSIGDGIRIVYLIPYENSRGKTFGSNIVLLVIALALLLVLTVWVLAAKRLMSGRRITKTQRRLYGARRMRRMAASLGGVGFLIILLAGMFSEALSGLYSSTNNCQSALDTLHSMMAENSAHEERLKTQRGMQYLSYAKRIAALLGYYPDLKTQEQLAEMSEAIGADYLMLYDDQGSEILSDSPYVNLVYGETAASSTYDFRRLMVGVPSIVHGARVDEVTGLNRQLIGVSMDDGDTSDGYGSLIVAIEPTSDSGLLTTEDIMRSLVTAESVAFAVSKETGAIIHATKRELTGKNAVESGMSAGSLRADFMDFFRLGNDSWYGCSSDQDGYLFYYAVRTGSVFSHISIDSLIPGLLFLAAYAVLTLVLLAGYTDRRIDASGIEVVDDHEWAYQEAEREEEKRAGNWWQRKTPEGKAWFTLLLLLWSGLAALAAVTASGGLEGSDMAIIPYVLNGAWSRGFNLFALTRIVMIVLGIMVILLGLKAVLSVLYGVLETKGETICRLIGSLFRYALIIVGLFFGLEALGFDTTTLLASLGIFSLAISLGAKDLVADVLSGIMIVFSGEYHIGDIVEIGGFRGKVWEIGVRSTTLVNKDGNMKNVSNRNVSNVMNLSRVNSRYTMKIAIPYDQPLDKVKEMLDKELPLIGEKIEEIADGPKYLGVTEIGAETVTLACCAECQEQNIDAVRSKMNLAIKDLFDRYKIPIK